VVGALSAVQGGTSTQDRRRCSTAVHAQRKTGILLGWRAVILSVGVG
jgi:hypothetical protein